MIEPAKRFGPAMALSAALLLAPACSDEPPGTPETTLTIEADQGPVVIRVEVADTSEERQRGLMGRRELAPDAGMVFLHDEPSTSGFWMKDTLIPLSVAFWDEQGQVIGVVDMEPCRAEPCDVYPAPGPWVGAVEVNQGFFEEHGVGVGDRVTGPA